MLGCLMCMACSKPPTAAVNTPALDSARLPRLSAMPQQGMLMSWVEPLAKGHILKFAIYDQSKWVRMGKVTSGENWFINWADTPSVAAIDENFWVAHWLVKQKGGKSYNYDVWVAVSNDAGRIWGKPAILHKDGAAAEHGFVNFFKDGKGAGAIWLDGRETVDKKDAAKQPNKSGNFSLRYAHINRNGSFNDEQVIDNNTCTCCQTSVVNTATGVVVAWRGRTDDEIRDNQISVLRKGKWSPKMPLGAEGWKIEGCPVNGPSLSARGNNVVAAWFSAANDFPRVRVAFSKDGGHSFAHAFEIDEAAPLGRIGLVWKDDQTAVVSWVTATNTASKKASLALRTVNFNGQLGEEKRIAEVSVGKDAGVPQIGATKRGVLLAFTGADIAKKGIQSMLVPWQDLPAQNSNLIINKAKSLFSSTKIPSFVASLCESKH